MSGSYGSQESSSEGSYRGVHKTSYLSPSELESLAGTGVDEHLVSTEPLVHETSVIKDLETRTQEGEKVLADIGISYTLNSPYLHADAAYRQALKKIGEKGEEVIAEFRKNLSMPVYDGVSDASAKEAVTKIIEGMATIQEHPSALQRFLYDQGGAMYRPLIDELDVSVLVDEMGDKGRNVYLKRVFTPSEIRFASGPDRLPFVRDGMPTDLYGRYLLLKEKGTFFWSTDQESLLAQDKKGHAVAEDEVIFNALLYEAETSTDSDADVEFATAHEKKVRALARTPSNASFDEMQTLRIREKKSRPYFPDSMARMEARLADGEVVAVVNAVSRTQPVGSTKAKDFERLDLGRSYDGVIVDASERDVVSENRREWLFTAYYDDKIRERDFYLANKDRFPIPSADALEQNPSLWDTPMVLNHAQRYKQATKVYDWFTHAVKRTGSGVSRRHEFQGLEDEGLELLVGDDVRRRVWDKLPVAAKELQEEAIRHNRPASLAHPLLEDSKEVTLAGNAPLTVFQRALLPTLQKYFPDVLETIEGCYGPQRMIVPEDIRAVSKELKATERDPFAEAAFLGGLSEAAPVLVASLPRLTPEELEQMRLESGLENALNGKVSVEGLVIGGYEVQRRIGMGGMGAVYHARDQNNERVVAFKVLMADKSTDDFNVQRFRRESKIGVRLDHPNIVKVWASGEYKGVEYMATEYMDGGTLKDRISEKGSLDVDETVAVLSSVGRALQEMEFQGVVDQDIKPDNILFNSRGQVKVGDLGLAVTYKEAEEQIGASGTPEYMAPEQWMQEPVDGRADLYALGVTAVEVLTGKKLYVSDNLGELFHQVTDLGEKTPSVGSFRPDLPSGLASIIDGLTEKDREKRTASASVLLEQLHNLKNTR